MHALRLPNAGDTTHVLTRLYDLYDERIGFFAVSPPGADWDGVFVAGEK